VFYFLDTDRDGFGVAGSDLCSCRAEGLRDAAVGGDCDDSNTAFNPAATEVCNGVDDNCDGLKDPAGAAGCLVYMADRDSDGFGVAGDTSCLCAPTYPYTSLISGDCDDTRALARPGRVETCNGFDDNCDGLTDLENSQGCLVYYRDADADGYALSGDFKCLCAATAPYLQPEPNGDCDDTNPEANAGKSEVCDGADNDCDGATDENNTQDCLRRYLDVDADGWGVTADWVCGCGVTAPYTATKGGDCDDSRPLVAPGKTEVCDGLDNNCDDATDPVDTVGCVAYYVDWDRDGYGVDSDTRCQCSASGSYSATAGGDCNDFNSRVSPGVAEKCGNSLDDDCDGYESEAGAEGCSTYYLDYDTDGYGDSASAQCLCSPGLEYRTTTGGDCCDRDDTTYPFAAGWHTTINNCNSWDFDCNGSVLKRWNADEAGCGGWGIGDGCDLHVGWSGSVPACGASGTYIYDGCGYCGFLWLNCCSAQKVARTQECY